jgi:hypothetical protein
VTPTGAAAWRHKSAKASAREFLELAERFGAGHITITDDLFTGRDPRTRRWVGEFASELIDAGNRTSFMIDTRADGVDHDLFALLRRAGLRRVFVGVESGSDEALLELDKRTGRRTAVKALETLGVLDIEVLLGFMYFTPLANRRTSLENAAFLREIGAADFELHVQRTRIYPGTPLEEQLRRQNLLTGSFPQPQASFADAEIAAFYPGVRRLADHVHSVVGPRMPLEPHQAKALFLEFNGAVQRALDGPRLSEAVVERWLLEESQRLTEWAPWHL